MRLRIEQAGKTIQEDTITSKNLDMTSVATSIAAQLVTMSIQAFPKVGIR
jgi:hypothetical protein